MGDLPPKIDDVERFLALMGWTKSAEGWTPPPKFREKGIYYELAGAFHLAVCHLTTAFDFLKGSDR